MEAAAPVLARLTRLRLQSRREAVVLGPGVMASLSSVQHLQLANVR